MDPKTELSYARTRSQPPLSRADIAKLLWRALGFVAFLAVIGAAIVTHTSLGTFIDPASLLIVGLGTAVLLFTVYGWAGVENALGSLIVDFGDRENTAEAVSFFRLGAAFALACGLLGTLIGLVIMLQNMSTPDALGPAMAVALLTQFYGILLAVASYCAAMIIARRQAATDVGEKPTRAVLPAAATVAAVGTLSVVLIFCLFLEELGDLRRELHHAAEPQAPAGLAVESLDDGHALGHAQLAAELVGPLVLLDEAALPAVRQGDGSAHSQGLAGVELLTAPDRLKIPGDDLVGRFGLVGISRHPRT